MKKFTLFAIPVFVIVLLFAGVFIWKMMTPTTPAVTTPTGPLPNSLNQATGTKPSNPFSGLFGGGTSVTPIPTPTPATAAAMNADLKTVGDDGGVSDFSSLQTQVSAL